MSITPEDLELVYKARDVMENEIHVAVQHALNKFKAETGLTPTMIVVDLREHQSVGQRTPERVLTQIRSRLELF